MSESAQASRDFPSGRTPFSLRLLSPRHWASWLGLGLAGILALCPAFLRRRIATHLLTPLILRNRRRVRIALRNLARCFPDLPERERRALLRDHARMLAQALLDTPGLWWKSAAGIARFVTVKGQQHIETARRENRPVLLLTGHCTGLEFGAQALACRYPTLGLVRDSKNPVFGWALARLRTRFHGRVYRREQGIRHVLRAMRRGAIFYYLPDEDLGRCHKGSTARAARFRFAPFFGTATYTLCGADRVARATDAVVLPCWTTFDPRSLRYTVEVFPPWRDFPGADSQQNAARVRAFLEQRISDNPAQYLWAQRMFQTRPEGEEFYAQSPDSAA